MIIGIVGLGLIGGSLAKTIKLRTEHRVLAYDLSESTMLKAELLEAIDGRLTRGNLPTCDVVLIALYPKAIIEYVIANQDYFKDSALLVDCGGVKKSICHALRDTVMRHNWTFIGGHPMAGREYSGFRYAKDDLFDNASMILTPYTGETIETVKFAKDFFLSIGFRRVQMATPENHDEMIAYTSQLAHIVSSVYVKCPLAMKHRGFSAGSFADMTRVARLNEDMWTELFLENQGPLLNEVEGLIERLCQYRDALKNANADALRGLLKEGREIKEKLEGD